MTISTINDECMSGYVPDHQDIFVEKQVNRTEVMSRLTSRTFPTLACLVIERLKERKMCNGNNYFEIS